MKLEIKDLVPYLPYKLKITFDGNEYVHELVGLDISLNGLKLISPFNDYGTAKLEDSKPLLHPLSRLTDVIRHNGSEFVPLIVLTKRKHPMGSNHRISPFQHTDNPNYAYIDFEIKNLNEGLEWLGFRENNRIGFCVKNPNYMQFVDFEQLIRWHFDVFGLIDKGLAKPIKA
tara:strand:- start:2421 stop:2936 length:516 start_codon:yes stop_codon:yes gene_type:complete